ncbi:hypothetical protein HK101_008005 [Irineochytrium annulatum]|nr:hypothetical protein HK101_008005 [Irineochytrium annulatum]
MLARSIIIAVGLSMSLVPSHVSAQGSRALQRNEPPDGKMIFGAWLFTQQDPNGMDRPSKFNQRIGFNAGVFQLSQGIPVLDTSVNPPLNHTADFSVLDDNTNAALFLTVYPNNGQGDGISLVQDSDRQALAAQLISISNTGRQVYVRYAPEMNGQGWFIYQKASQAEYIASYIALVNAVRSQPGGDAIAFVWAPNLSQEYTSDLYAGWYPGDEYVDWVGLSIYWKGPKGHYPWHARTLAPSDFIAQIIDGFGSDGSATSFYNLYCVARGKPFVLTEGAAAYNMHYTVNNSPDVITSEGDFSLRDTEMSFWGSMFNDAFLAAYPMVKMAISFEFTKTEIEGPVHIDREFRSSFDPDTLGALRGLLQTYDAKGLFQWAGAKGATLASTTTAGGTTAAGGSGSGGAAGQTSKAPVTVSRGTSAGSSSTKSGALGRFVGAEAVGWVMTSMAAAAGFWALI